MKRQLSKICHARSGDKGDTGNIGLIARKPEYFPVIKKYVTADTVKNHFAGICLGKVERFELRTSTLLISCSTIHSAAAEQFH